MRKPTTKPAAKPPVDLAGGKFSVIDLGGAMQFMLPTAAAMKVLDLLRGSVPVRQDYGRSLRNRTYVVQPVRERYSLEILNQADQVLPCPPDGDAGDES